MFGMNSDYDLLTGSLHEMTNTSEVGDWARVEGFTSKAARDPERDFGEAEHEGVFSFLSLIGLHHFLRRNGRAA